MAWQPFAMRGRAMPGGASGSHAVPLDPRVTRVTGDGLQPEDSMNAMGRWTCGTRVSGVGLGLAAVLVLTGCEGASAPGPEGAPADPTVDAAVEAVGALPPREGGELAPEQEVFWAAFEAHCGRAYPGEVSDVTPYYADGVVGTEMVMHVMECEEDRLHIPFHIDDNRSRNWILTREGGTIRLKHDHRNPDGTEEEISQYGGDAPRPGLPTRQIFPADAHTAAILPDRADNFWFFDFIDEETLQYGVHWPKFGHSIRVEFDLSSPIEPPPRPWGYEEEG